MADGDRPASKSKTRSRPTSGATPKERTPRQSGEKRHSRSPEKKQSRSPEKKQSQSPEKKQSQSPEKKQSRSPEKRSSKPGVKIKATEYEPSQTSSNVLSVDSLAKLNAENEKTGSGEIGKAAEKQRKEKAVTEGEVTERVRHKREEDRGRRRKKRIVSGAILEEGDGRRGGYISPDEGRPRIGRGGWLAIGLVLILLAILIPVGVYLAGRNSKSNSAASGPSSTPAPNESLNGVNVPTSAKGGYLDPFTWYDTKDFNVTYTNETIGGLPIMGLNSNWDDTAKANEYVPALNEKFAYGTMPIRGVNLGGWLSIEPFITPSLFNTYDSKLGIVDEYTLCKHLGPEQAAQTLEKHYSTFINEQTFKDVQAAGFDHVRIPYSYWAVTTYPGDPYVPKISWRYLLRGIEYARKYGLRVNLDLHGAPGSQNGWNHSGRLGVIGWLNGTDGQLNGQRSLDLHEQLSTFFAQPRYKNVIAIYGLVNEPKMTRLPPASVIGWTTSAIQIVRKNGITQTIAFGDGFLGLPNWQGKLQGIEGLVMDAHQYVIFNVDQIGFSHKTKLNFACSGWAGQMKQSINTATGYVLIVMLFSIPTTPRFAADAELTWLPVSDLHFAANGLKQTLIALPISTMSVPATAGPAPWTLVIHR